MNPSQPTAPAAPSPTADQGGPQQPTQEEVNAAITREQEATIGYLNNRVLQLSILNSRQEAELAELRQQVAAQVPPA